MIQLQPKGVYRKQGFRRTTATNNKSRPPPRAELISVTPAVATPGFSHMFTQLTAAAAALAGPPSAPGGAGAVDGRLPPLPLTAPLTAPPPASGISQEEATKEKGVEEGHLREASQSFPNRSSPSSCRSRFHRAQSLTLEE